MNKYETSKIVGFCPARKWENKTWVFNINLKLWLNQYKLYLNKKICWNPKFSKLKPFLHLNFGSKNLRFKEILLKN